MVREHRNYYENPRDYIETNSIFASIAELG